jgi:hypothetical protein
MVGCPRCGSLNYKIKEHVYKERSCATEILYSKRICECGLKYEK